MKKLIYGPSGSGKSQEILNFVNDNDQILIASPFRPSSYKGINVKPRNNWEEETEAFSRPLYDGIWHCLWLKTYNAPTFLLPLALGMNLELYDVKEILAVPDNTFIIWHGFEDILAEPGFAEYLLELPCNVIVEYCTNCNHTEDDQVLNAFREIGGWDMERHFKRPFLFQ